jgi:poly(A) polymerase
MEAHILQRSDHCVSRKNISRNAQTVLYRLNEKGYKAYLAGGCVRDLMLGFQPKDFDVVTDATPQEVKRCFRNCRLIGRRFRLAHVMFRDEIIEVATFRAPTTPVEPEEDEEDTVEDEVSADRDIVVNEETGVVMRDNEYGTPEEDAFRRDFTINALFYNIEDFSIIDYVGGLKDLERKVVHCIGDPDLRYQEDPVRMIRALRFAATLQLEVEDNTYQAILRQAAQLSHASHARMYEEILKFLYSGAMERTFPLWQKTGLFDVMFPGFADWYRDRATEQDKAWLTSAFQQLDKWKRNGVKASQELAYTFLLAPFIRSVWQDLQASGDLSPRDAGMEAVHQVQHVLKDRILIPKRILYRIFDLLFSQSRFDDRQNPQRSERFVRRPYFRDALVLYKFDGLVSGDADPDLIRAWSEDLKHAPPVHEHKRPPQRRGRRSPRGRNRRR